MKTCLQINNYKNNTDNLFAELQDDVLDEYNKGTISLKEMKNIISWCQKMKERLVQDYEKDDNMF